jgi:hypothetical protein
VKAAPCRRGKPPWVLVALILLQNLIPGSTLRADACAPIDSSVRSPSGASTIVLAGANLGRAVDSTAMATAAGNWNQACESSDNPWLATTGTGDFRVHVDFYAGSDTNNGIECNGKCACTRLSTSSTGGAIIGATVQMFEKQRNGTPCTANSSQILTHELGHALGLADSNCSGRIMGDLGASIAAGDCMAVDMNFRTFIERLFPEPTDHEGPCGT